MDNIAKQGMVVGVGALTACLKIELQMRVQEGLIDADDAENFAREFHGNACQLIQALDHIIAVMETNHDQRDEDKCCVVSYWRNLLCWRYARSVNGQPPCALLRGG